MKIGKISNIVLNLIIILLCAITLYPLLLTISVSLTSEQSIVESGYALIPKQWSFEAYSYIWDSRETILRAYAVTAFITVVGTILSVLTISLIAYPLSRKDFKYRNAIALFIFFPTMFSGGLVAEYMLYVNVYNLADSIWVLILPYLTSAWYVVILRTFFTTNVPQAIIESAKIDGAGEFRILFGMVFPMAIPGIATIALFKTLQFWNEYFNSLMYITDADKYTLQFLLQTMMQNITELRNNTELAASMSSSELANIPAETARMALCMVVLGPILIVYPFFQKYFIQGLTVGAVKG